MAWFFEIYLQMRQGAQAASPLNPFSMMPFAATNALTRAFTQPPTPQAANQEPPPGFVGPGHQRRNLSAQGGNGSSQEGTQQGQRRLEHLQTRTNSHAHEGGHPVLHDSITGTFPAIL